MLSQEALTAVYLGRADRYWNVLSTVLVNLGFTHTVPSSPLGSLQLKLCSNQPRRDEHSK